MRVVLLYTILAATLALAHPLEDEDGLMARDDADVAPEGGFTVTYVDEDAEHAKALADTSDKRDLGPGGEAQLAKRACVHKARPFWWPIKTCPKAHGSGFRACRICTLWWCKNRCCKGC